MQPLSCSSDALIGRDQACPSETCPNTQSSSTPHVRPNTFTNMPRFRFFQWTSTPSYEEWSAWSSWSACSVSILSPPSSTRVSLPRCPAEVATVPTPERASEDPATENRARTSSVTLRLAQLRDGRLPLGVDGLSGTIAL